MTKGTFYKWDDMPQTEMTPQIRRRVVSGEKVMSVQFIINKGAVISEHKHPHEQISHMISGAVEFDVAGEKRIIRGGEVLHIPSNVPHSAVALEDSVNIEIFSPPREDFLSNEPPAYMQE